MKDSLPDATPNPFGVASGSGFCIKKYAELPNVVTPMNEGGAKLSLRNIEAYAA